MSKKTFDLWNSDDETTKNNKLKNLFDFDDEDDDSVVDITSLKLSSKQKKPLFGAAKVTSSLTKSENVIDSNMSKNSAVAESKHTLSLFDEDVDESPVKLSTVNRPKADTSKIKTHSLYETDEDDDYVAINGSIATDATAPQPTTSSVNFEKLYLEEKAQRMKLQLQVVELQGQVILLQQRIDSLTHSSSNSNTVIDESNTVSVFAVNDTPNNPIDTIQSTAEPESESVSESVSEEVTVQNNWEKLANEEKERRQKQRVMKNKPRPVSVAAKRLASKAPVVIGDVEAPVIAVTPVVAVTSSNSNQKNGTATAWDASSDEETEPDRSSTLLKGVVEAEVESAESAADKAHWESLAAMDRERKAQVRRHRPTAGAARPKSLKASVLHSSHPSSTSHTPLATTASNSPIPQSVSGTNISGMVNSTGIGSNPNMVPATRNKHTEGEENSDDSGWDSEEGVGDESDNEDDGQESRETESQCVTPTAPSTSTKSNNNTVVGISSEIEAEIDTKLTQWVRKCRNNITQLLQSVHTVYNGPLPNLQDIWMDQSEGDVVDDPVLIRKAYLKIVRTCHPDKQMHLDANSREFVEASRVFTIISDAYNKYKATSGGV